MDFHRTKAHHLEGSRKPATCFSAATSSALISTLLFFSARLCRAWSTSMTWSWKRVTTLMMQCPCCNYPCAIAGLLPPVLDPTLKCVKSSCLKAIFFTNVPEHFHGQILELPLCQTRFCALLSFEDRSFHLACVFFPFRISTLFLLGCWLPLLYLPRMRLRP